MKKVFILFIIVTLALSPIVHTKSKGQNLEISKLEVIYKYIADSEHEGTVLALSKGKVYTLSYNVFRSDNFSLSDTSLNIYNPKIALTSSSFIIYIRYGGTITFFDLIQEKIKWTLETDDTCVNAYLVNNSKIYFQGQRRSILLDLNGKTIWKTNGWKEETKHIFTLLDRIYFVSNKMIYGISIENGKILFNKEFNYPIKKLFPNQNNIYLLLSSGKMLYYYDKDLNFKGALLNQKDQYINDCHSLNQNIYVCANNRIISIDGKTLKNRIIFDYFKSKHSFEYIQYLSITSYDNNLVVFSEYYIDFINLSNNQLTKRLSNELIMMGNGVNIYDKPNLVYGDNKLIFQIARNIICVTDSNHKPPRGYGDYEPKSIDLGIFEFIKKYGNYGYFTNNSQKVNKVRLIHNGLPDEVNYLLKTPTNCNLQINPLKEDGHNYFNKVEVSLTNGYADIEINPYSITSSDFDSEEIASGNIYSYIFDLQINEKDYLLPVSWTIANSRNHQILLKINHTNAYIHDPKIGKLPRTITYQLNKPPTIIGGVTMLPLRFISEILGYQVEYEEKTKKITIKLDNYDIIMIEGNKECFIGNNKTLLTSPPTNIGGSVMVPLRFLADNLSLKLTWTKETQVILLEKTNIEFTSKFNILDEYNQNSLQPLLKYNKYYLLPANEIDNNNTWLLLFDSLETAKTFKKGTIRNLKGLIYYNLTYDKTSYGTGTYPSIVISELID